MLSTENLQKSLEQFAAQVVDDAKANLQNSKKVVSGKLYNSLKVSNIRVSSKSIELNVSMAVHGAFVDQGVSGKKVKYDTPYSYKDKMPPPSALDSWIVRKGLAPRKNGKFTGRSISAVGFKNSIQFAIARSIFYNGIKPNYFLTNAVKKNYGMLPKIIEESFALDVKKTVDFMIKSNFNNLKK